MYEGEYSINYKIGNMKVLIGCEESQAVTKEFREKGHNAFSCDILDCSGGHPEWHIKDSIFHALCSPKFSLGLDFLGLHPPCTFLANSGVRWLYNKDGSKNLERWENMRMSALFFKSCLANLKTVGKGYIENPIMHKHAMEIIGEKPTQIIQPWQYGHGETKATCLWIVGLPKLKPTNIVDGRDPKIHRMPPGKDRGKLRSKTYEGIAKAMAEQWG
jgi:hypothetical protein